MPSNSPSFFRQAQKAKNIAAALAKHPCVEKVYFPGHDVDKKSQDVFQRQCTGTGSMLSFSVIPCTREASYTVLNNLSVAHLAVSLGSTETLVQHPRSMTHSGE